MTSRADQHDCDKLDRWCRDLTEPSGTGVARSFPLYAVFLVSELDRTAHDIFRAFRRSFEQREAGFGNLIIFGQHGVSSTVRRLLARLDLPPGSIPLLLLLPAAVGSSLYLLPLPAGSASPAGTHPLPAAPLNVLARVEEFADQAREPLNEALDVAGVSGLSQVPLPAADLITLVSQLAGEIGP